MSSRSAQKAASSRSRRFEEKKQKRWEADASHLFAFYEGKRILDKKKIKFEKKYGG